MGSGKSNPAPLPAPKPAEQEPFDQTVDLDKKAKAQDDGQTYIEQADEKDRQAKLGETSQASSGLNVG